MSDLTAADLQRMHGLEGAADPFPPFPESAPAEPRQSSGSAPPDASSQEAFPSLAPSQPAALAASAWGTAPRIRPVVPRAPAFTESFTLSAADIAPTSRDGKPLALGTVMKQVIAQFKGLKLDSSTNTRARQTTFYLKSESQHELEKARRALLAGISPIVTIVLDAPASTIPAIIGAKGATLKQVREQTGVRVDIPPRDTATNGHVNGTSAPADDEDEPTIPVSITGPAPLAQEARDMLAEIVASRRSHTTQRVRDIPAHVLPFLIPRRSVFEQAAQGGDITLTLDAPALEISVFGEREAVARVVETIRSAQAFFTAETSPLKLTLPKRQHRLLVERGAAEVMAQGKCAVIVPAPEDPSEEITVWGRTGDLANGVSAVMARANSAYIHEFPLPGPVAVSRQLLGYMLRIDYPRTLADAHPGVAVYPPPQATVEKASLLSLDIVGEKPSVDAAVRQVSELIGKLIGATKDVPIEWLAHSIINSPKNAKKIKAFYEDHNVLVYFPREEEERSNVLLVYDPFSPKASPSPVEKAKNLEDVEKELLELAKAAADIKTETVPVEKKWQEVVVGKNRTTLNAIIGEEKTLSVKVGAEAGIADNEDVIVVRGIRGDVDRAVKEILQIVEDAKNDAVVSGYTTEFEIDQQFVGRIVGSGGAGVNKLRDTLGVKIDFQDEGEEKDAGKKKKAPSQKAKVTIVGRKENAEEAKRRIISQAERLADETSEVIKISHQYHPSLIGQGGRYAIRLEEKYGVKITFPRDAPEGGEGRTRETLKQDEVLLKGGKRGVAQVKAELLEAVEFEKEHNHTLTFNIPARAVARVLGRAGATISDIKDRTGAQIDVDRAAEVATVTCRGTKDAIAEAKVAILEIADNVQEETTETLDVPSQFHRTIIGGGGQGLRDLIAKCGGPTDAKTQAGLIRFPRQGEPGDEVRLRGEPALVKKLKQELETIVATLRDRVVLGIEIPAAQHRALIGRGGQHLTELQNRHSVQVQFPGSRSYHQVGEPENAADLEGGDPANLVKVTGTRAACEKALAELKKSVKPPAPEAVTATASVPLKYHHAVTQQGNLFRTLRSVGVQVEVGTQPKNPAVPPHPTQQSGASEARIDDSDEAAVPGVQWQVVANHQDSEEGESEWTLRGRDQAALDRAQKIIQEAIERAENMSHVGFLTLSDRTSFPRIVGTKGANVARLRDESGADITVSREDSTITIVGSEAAIEVAKEAILRTVSTPSGPRRGGRRDGA